MRNITSLALMVMTFTMMTTEKLQAVDTVSNGGFETQGTIPGGGNDTATDIDAADWSQRFAGVRNMDQARTGDWSMRVDRIAGGFPNTSQLIDFGFDVGGEAFTYTAWGLNPSSDPLVGDQQGLLKVEFFDSNDGALGGPFITALNAATPQDVWTQSNFNFNAPATTFKINLQLMNADFGGADNSGTVFWDDASLEGPAIVPEPAALTLFVLGGALIGVTRLRGRRA